ncbi:MAG: transcription-repair coupling factor [Bacillota bacterium]|nr:transcription-repair coupling factor [Bacillota bacterium]
MKNFLADPLLALDSYKDLLADIEKKKKVIATNGLLEEALGHFIYSISCHTKKRKIFVISYSDLRARRIYEDLKSLGLERAYYFPKKEDFFYKSIARSSDRSNEQIQAMWALTNQDDSIVVTSYQGILNKLMAKEKFSQLSFSIDMTDRINVGDLGKKLLDSAYENVPAVEGKGQFSLRGGIIDIFPPTAENPYRIELFDDEVDSIRTFDVLSQRSIENLEEISIPVARENILSNEDRLKAIEGLNKDLNKSKIKDDQVLLRLKDKFSELVDRLENKLFIKNLDLVLAYIDQNKLASILDYTDADTLFFIDEPRRIDEANLEESKDFANRFSDLLMAGEVLPGHENSFFSYDQIIEKIKDRTKLTFSNILRDNKHFKPEAIFNFHMKAVTSYNGRMDIFKEEIERYLYRGYKIAILAGDQQRLKRLDLNLTGLGIKASLAETLDQSISSSQILLSDLSLRHGFEYSDLKFTLMNQREIYGSGLKKKKPSRKKKRKEDAITDFADIALGDYVVHENNGVGIYQGTHKLEVQGVTRDYILIQYRGADRLYIPTDQLGMIHKYIGTGDKKPKVNKLNSVEWTKTKLKAKKSIDDMADELIKLYAARQAKEGFQFSEDSLWQGEFEDAFPYEETQGQLEASREIKDDMEKKAPMDRLLCADVGYGKTEVALRAAFKAVMDGKQVAILVPTTILAQQHYNTMVERFRDFPVTIGLLSRFRTKGQINDDIKKLRNGSLDIVVGTHRLLSKDVVFKDLGLLIIDEEQRFGVRHKETLKMLKENVDTLTLTATPIPRTLQMSMIGIRNMSLIDEPPEERFPIQTYLAEYNPSMIREAILREIDRQGQVYFLHNRVSDIDKIALELQELVPEASFLVAHGQMTERALEDAMMSFLEKEADVLVCTTIIETGLDIPNVNTIIINNADRFGLSQLYQLRGRVGRSNRVAYAYLTYPRDKQLSEVSEKRLTAIKEYTEFGSGYKIAMRDLEIRGAGNILSAQQHGHIDNIGYDLYLSLLEDAMKKLKGEEVQDINETTIDLNIEAHIPESYIEDQKQRLEFYKKISLIENDEDYSDLIAEAIDRYGDLPEATSNLIDISQIKFIANQKGIEMISGDSKKIRLKFKAGLDLDLRSLNNLIAIFSNKISFNCKGQSYIDYRPGKYPLEELKDLLANIV